MFENFNEVTSFFNLNIVSFSLNLKGAKAAENLFKKMKVKARIIVCNSVGELRKEAYDIQRKGMIPFFWVENRKPFSKDIFFYFVEEVDCKIFFGGVPHHYKPEIKKMYDLYLDINL